MDKIKVMVYSDNLHFYDYDELVESYNIKDTGKNDKDDISDDSTTEDLPKHIQYQDKE